MNCNSIMTRCFITLVAALTLFQAGCSHKIISDLEKNGVYNESPVVINTSNVTYARSREPIGINVTNKNKNYLFKYTIRNVSDHIKFNSTIGYKLGDALEVGAPMVWGKYFDIRSEGSPTVEMEILRAQGDALLDMYDLGDMKMSGNMSITLKGTIYDANKNYVDEIITTQTVSNPPARYESSKASSYYINPGDLLGSAMNDIIIKFFANGKVMASLHKEQQNKSFVAASPDSKPAVISASSPASSAGNEMSDVDILPQVSQRVKNNNYAVVIGIESYRQRLPKADFATNDAKTVSKYLTKALGYPEENVITLLNDFASRNDMEKYLGTWLRNNVEPMSTVFIYFSGHGAPNPKTGDAYLVPYDGDPTFIADTGYSLKQLYDNLAKLNAKQVVVALDSCFSGAGGKSVAAKGTRSLVRVEKATAHNIAVLTASADDQTSSSYDEKYHGVFTYYLLKGMKGALEEDKYSKVELGELYNYIKPQVEKVSRKIYNNEQTPQLIINDERLRKIELR